MLDNLPVSASLTRERVETRILDLPLEALGLSELQLAVLPRQTKAIATNVAVIERVAESRRPEHKKRLRHDAHPPFARLHVERRTKLDQKTHTGDNYFDLGNLRRFIEMSEDETRRYGFYGQPNAFRTFTPETIADLVRLNDRALELYSGIDWDAVTMNTEEQR